MAVRRGDRDSIRAAVSGRAARLASAAQRFAGSFSDDGMVNALPLNSLYSVANAVAAARTISQAIPS